MKTIICLRKLVLDFTGAEILHMSEINFLDSIPLSLFQVMMRLTCLSTLAILLIIKEKITQEEEATLLVKKSAGVIRS